MNRWLLVAILGACATRPPTEIARATTATYVADRPELLRIAAEVASDQLYAIREVDPARRFFVTTPRAFTLRGDHPVEELGRDEKTGPAAFDVAFVVEVVSEIDPVGQPHSKVIVTPKVRSHRRDALIAPDDPSMPRWATARANDLATAIYERARRYVVVN